MKDLELDLANYRTVSQADEAGAVQAMISISPDYFWGLMESLLNDGYLPTENVLVLEGATNRKQLTVKEGNRRVAALKLIHGYLQSEDLDIPDYIKDKMGSTPKAWRTANLEVPCTVFGSGDADVVDRVVSMAHGKGEKAGRDSWNAVAAARHNRDFNKASEPALDLLEKYLKSGKNITERQRERWAGDYPLSVLRETIQKLAGRFGVTSAQELASRYPKVSHRVPLEEILQAVGLKHITFTRLRKKDADVGANFGLPPLPTSQTSSASESSSSKTETAKTNKTEPSKKAATAVTDPRSVKGKLRYFQPLGPNREKVVQLLEEARQLDLRKNPLAFCFVLRSMFELSAKAYCTDHKTAGGPPVVKGDGSDRALCDILRDITKHLTNQGTDKAMKKAMKKVLHGAMTELGKKEGILSVTSMNQLVHNPSFSIQTGDICTLFGNIYPLLEAMNQ